MGIVAKASEFAATKHEKQRRKYTDQPYFEPRRSGPSS